jgi:site-specific recombinase XerD
MAVLKKYIENYPINYPMIFSGKLTYKFIIKDDYVRADGTCALFLQIFLNKERKRIPVHISVKPDEFDKVKQRVKPKCAHHKDFNLILEKMLADLNKIEVSYRLSNVPLSIKNIVEEYENPTARIDFIKFWDNEMIQQKELLKAHTYRQQVSILNKVKGYQKTVYFYEITEEWFFKMKAYFKKKEKNSDSTIGSLVKSFKKYLHIANKKGIVTPLMYNDIHNKVFVGNRTFLDSTEIEKLHQYYKTDFINEAHKAILARFLFSCFTGLRISDIQKITKENIIGDVLVFSSEKTNKLQRIQLNKTALSFINPRTIFGDHYTPEYINRELKLICKIVGIKKRVSFHVARHTFATNFLIYGGRVEVLQKLLAHSKINETMIYVHIVESSTSDQLQHMDELLNIKALN